MSCRRVLGLAGGFEVVRKIQNEEGVAADDNGGSGGDTVAEVSKRMKRKNMTDAAVGRKTKQNRTPLAPGCLEAAEKESMVKRVSGREKKQHKSQEMEGGGDLLDTSEEMVDEEYESGVEGLCINRNSEERNKKVLGEEQRGESETENTVEESEEDSKLLTIRYQGEVMEVWARQRWRVCKVVTAWVTRMGLAPIAKTLSFTSGSKVLRWENLVSLYYFTSLLCCVTEVWRESVSCRMQLLL